ncbi:MAG: hypothetical protein ABI693_03230 [Bryobacteraceae bacterium]
MRQSFTRQARIDGSQNPTLISDRIAYRLFFLALAEPRNPTPEQRKRLSAKLTLAALSGDDIDFIASALADYQERGTDLLRKHQPTGGSQAIGPNSTFEDDMDTLVSRTQSAIKARLAPGAFARLDRLVQREKANMKAMPFPQME